MGATKIQINSLAALERLIGGDTELEMEIRDNIVNEFTKKHLKALIKTETMRLVAAEALQEIKDTFFEYVKGSWQSEIKFKPEVIARLKDDFDTRAHHILMEVVQGSLEREKVQENINKALETTSKWIMEELMEENLEARLNKMVDAKLKDKLGIK